jgi:hypothetical protein
MENREKDFLEVCTMLTQMAILKNSKLEEKQVALMAKFLLSELSLADINQACTYLARRKDRMPDVADFFNLVAPMPSIEEITEREIGGLMALIKDGWDNSKGKLSDTQKDLLEVWSWSELAKSKESDLQKTRINMTFFLRNKLGSDGKGKLLASKQAFINYQQDLKLLEGNKNEIENTTND